MPNRKLPRQTKIIRGTFRPARNPEQEPEPTVLYETPKPPPGMNRWAKRMWKRVVDELVNTKVLTEVDVEGLQLACEAYGEYEEAKQAIYKPVNPLTGKRCRRTMEQYLSGLDPWIDVAELEPLEFSKLRRNSQTAMEMIVMRGARQAFKSLVGEYGLTPVSRNRIDVGERSEKVDPMEEIINAK